jgi:hypothetical protein
MRTSFLLAMTVGLGVLAGCGGDDGDDSFEGSYARAACEQSFECYPSIRRNFQDDVERCMGSLLTEWQRRLDSYGEECAEATLALWACQSQAICNTESTVEGPCAAPLVGVRNACPDATSP